jgi:hypothetical protein
MTKRERHKANSNNQNNPCKNKCGLAVAKALGVEHSVRYLHTINDLLRAARSRYTVRSRLSAAKAKEKSVGSVRANIAALDGLYHIVRVPGHVILLDRFGNTVVDTAPRKRDHRKITHLYTVIA